MPWAAARHAAHAARATTAFVVPASGRPSHRRRKRRPRRGDRTQNGGQGRGRAGRPSSSTGGARLFLRRRAAGTPPFCAGARLGGRLSLRRRSAQRAFPRFQRRAGTQRAIGKTRSAAEVCGATSGLDDLERIFGAGAGLAGTAGLVPPYAPFRSFPYHLLSLF